MQKTLKYFLASNSCEGFINHFSDCYNPEDNWRCFIIKGGPGTGKSSFMKKVAATAEQKGEKYLLCPCSSDPDSLDAIILPDIKTVILDGTSPHTIDPKYPAVCEEILNFGDFWDKNKIYNPHKIIEITNLNKSLHQTAQKYLKAAGQIILDNYKTALKCTKIPEAQKFAEKLCKKYIPNKKGTGYEWVRFIEGITPQGIMTFYETPLNSCETTIVISDRYKACSNIIMKTVRDFALSNGYEIITLKNPYLPSLIIDHIIIPELSLSFVTETNTLKFKTDTRRIHSRRFTSNQLLHTSKQRITLNERLIKNLLSSACETLKKAKLVHDELESYYINAMNFNSLEKFTEKFCKNLL